MHACFREMATLASDHLQIISQLCSVKESRTIVWQLVWNSTVLEGTIGGEYV